MKEVTDKERRSSLFFWANQGQAIEGRVSETTMSWFNTYTAPDNIGYEMGQLRPGKLGQFDLYSWLTDLEIGCDENEALIASGLTAMEVAKEKRREEHRVHGIDVDNEIETAMYDHMRNMNPEELNEVIERLEEQLARIKQFGEIEQASI